MEEIVPEGLCSFAEQAILNSVPKEVRCYNSFDRHRGRFLLRYRAPLEMLLRVPGIGAKSAYKITEARRFTALTFEHLKKMRVVLKINSASRSV